MIGVDLSFLERRIISTRAWYGGGAWGRRDRLEGFVAERLKSVYVRTP